MTFDINAAVQQAATQGPNMNEAQKGGGGTYVPPAEGLCRLRLIGYIEGGKQRHEYQGAVSYKDKVKLIFELSGPKHQPRMAEDGTPIPFRITIEETLSLSEKANFYKLFRAMNYDGQATHMAQLLGREFLGNVHHITTNKGNTLALLKGPQGYTIRSPYYEDPMTGERHHIAADPQMSETRCFLWEFPSKAMWDSLYIEGMYEERKDDKGNVVAPAKSKNVFQDWIRSAQNFAGSPMADILEGGELDLPSTAVQEEAPAEADASDDMPPWVDDNDPLAGIA